MKNIKVDLTDEYIDKFGGLPPIHMGMSTSHPIYQRLMRVAIDTNTPITTTQLEKEMDIEGVEVDRPSKEEEQ